MQDIAELVGGRLDVERFDGLEHVALVVLVEMTSGRETMTSKPSRRICSTRMAICISPRALTFEDAGAVGVGELDADVGAGFADEAVADMARGEEFAFASGERGIVDDELHLDGGRIDVDEGHGCASSLSVMVSPMKTSSKPARPTMLPALASLISILARPAWERSLVTALFLAPSLWMQTILSPTVTLPPVDFAVGDAAEVIAVIEVGHEHFEMFVEGGDGGGESFR
jgi:hypothetical protein